MNRCCRCCWRVRSDRFACRRFESVRTGRPGSCWRHVATRIRPTRVVVNSCSVTAAADQGTRQTVRRIARDNPNARIVVTGCYATRHPGEVAALPNVERVVVNDDKPRLIQLLRRPEETAERAKTAE